MAGAGSASSGRPSSSSDATLVRRSMPRVGSRSPSVTAGTGSRSSTSPRVIVCSGEPRSGVDASTAVQPPDPRSGISVSGEPRNGEPRNGEPRSGEPRNGDPRNGEPRRGEPRNGDPRNGVAAIVPPTSLCAGLSGSGRAASSSATARPPASNRDGVTRAVTWPGEAANVTASMNGPCAPPCND